MALSPEAEARLLEAEAADYEAQAKDRYDRSARWYGGGSSNFVRSVDTADAYRQKAKELRAKAAEYRAQAARARADERR